MPNADRMIQLSKGMLTGGAGGTIGSARAAAATPDGYTLLAAAMGSHVAAPVLTPNVKCDPVVDFVPIGISAHSPAVVIARKDFPAQDLKEFIAVLRQRGDALKEAHGSIGAIPAKAECNPAAFDRFVRSEMARWAPILTATRAEK